MHVSTNNSLGLINNIHSAGVDNFPSPDRGSLKRSRSERASLYDIPVSPERPQESPRIEPRNARRALRNRKTPNPAPDQLSNSSVDEEDGEPNEAEPESERGDAESNDGESASGANEKDDNGEEPQPDDTNESENEYERDPLSEQVDLFPDEDGDEVGDGDEHMIENEHGHEDQPDKSSDKISAQDQAESMSTTAPKNTVEVQIPLNTVTHPSESSHSTHAPINAPHSLSIESSQHRVVPETPAIDQVSPDQSVSKGHDIYNWLAETIAESGFKEVWEDILKIKKTIKLRADPSMKGSFNHIKKMINRLRRVYKMMTNTPVSDAPTIRTWRDQCSLIANNIFKEVQWVIYDDAQTDEEGGARLVDQIEAYIIPLLIELVLFSFKAYKVGGNLLQGSFCTSLDLLWGCSYKIASFGDISVTSSMGKLMPSVKNIKDALESGTLREKAQRIPGMHGKYRHFQLTEVDSHISCEPWSRQEKSALRRAYESARRDGLTGKSSVSVHGVSDDHR